MQKLPFSKNSSRILAVSFALAANIAFAHEEGAPFSDAIIDPLSLHHAHIENEQRINFFGLDGVVDDLGRKHFAFETELELAYATRDFKYGFEFFIPLANVPAPDGDGRNTGIGDIEIRPIKYALFQRPFLVVSTASGIRLPTGSKSDGLGQGSTGLTQYLFADAAAGNWFLGANLAMTTNVSGETQSTFEYGAVLSYSFIRRTRGFEVAKAAPAQKWIVSPSVELVGESNFRGVQAGRGGISINPGLTFWHRPTGWQIHVGALLPVSGAREADRVFLLQVGNHFNWGRLVGLRR